MIPVEVHGTADALWAAGEVIRQHREQAERIQVVDGYQQTVEAPSWRVGCAQCDGNDPNCRMLVWALAERRAADIG